MRVDQARAAVRGLEAKLALTADQVAAQTSKADAAATRHRQRRGAAGSRYRARWGGWSRCSGSGFVTAQQVDQARTAQRTAQIALQQARLQADEARQAITNTKPTEAELEGARATLALAERDLNKTVVRAPCDGRITALDIAAGEFAATGHPLFTIIDTEHWYAIGNFRETDLAGIEPGQRATVYVMAQPSRPLRGEVDSLGWGVASDVSATFGGLPHVERTLASAASSLRGARAASPSFAGAVPVVESVSRIEPSLRVIASASGRAAPVAVIATGSALGASPSSSARPARGRPPPPGRAHCERCPRRVASRAREAEPVDVVDQRGTPGRGPASRGAPCRRDGFDRETRPLTEMARLLHRYERCLGIATEIESPNFAQRPHRSS